MKTKKKFFLKAAGISPVKGAGISLALVMMFAMAFAACDSDGSSSKSGNGPIVSGPEVMGTGAETTDWAQVVSYLEAVGADAPSVIYIRESMNVPSGTAANVNEVRIPSGKTLVIVGEINTTNASVAELPEGVNYLATPNPTAPRLYIQKYAKLTVQAGGRLVLGGPQSTVYGGIVNVLEGGALHVQEGAVLSLNMSSNVYVSGANSDIISDYIALNIESRAKVAVVGNFQAGDTLLTIESDNIHLIGVSREDTPVALGAALLYAEIPTPGAKDPPVNADLQAAYDNNRGNVSNYSKVKVANTYQEVLEHIAKRDLYPLVTLIYSGEGALSGPPTNPGLLAIPDKSYNYNDGKTPTTLVIQNDVLQNTDLTITGKVEIADGASITVVEYKTVPAKLTLGTTNDVSLNIERGGTLAVGAGGTLDLSFIPATAPSTGEPYPITLDGEIAVAAGGRINLPPVYTADQTIPQVSWGTGHVTLASGSLAFLNITGNGKTDSASLTYYIGPASATNGPEFSWTAGYTDGGVTLVGLDITLDGHLTVTGATDSTGAITGNTAIMKKATVAGGVLTVDNNPKDGNTNEFKILGKLEVASGASVVVADYGILNLALLPSLGRNETAQVTLNGVIEVNTHGIIVLPKPLDDSATVEQIKYVDGGKIKLNAGSTLVTASITPGAPGSPDTATDKVAHFAPSTLPTLPSHLTSPTATYYEWAASDTSYVDLTNDSILLSTTGSTGSLKVAASSVSVYNKFTVGSKTTLTVGANPSAAGNTLKLEDGAQLVVDGTIVAQAGTSTYKGGTLDLTTGATPTLTLNGTITAQAYAEVDLPDDLASTQIKWGVNGNIKLIKDSTLNAGTVSPYLGGSGLFQWGAGTATSTANDSVTLKQNQMIVDGALTATSADANPLPIANTAITVNGRLAIKDNKILLLKQNATITVEDGSALALSDTYSSGGQLALEKNTSKLILKPGARVIAGGAGDSIIGYRDSVVGDEEDVWVSVERTLGGGLTYISTSGTTDITVYSATTGSGLLQVGKFAATYGASLAKVKGGIATTPAAAPGSLEAGRTGTGVLGAYITFEGPAE
jgi:hypothetical protein